MSIAIEVSDTQAEGVKSGEKVLTYQVYDELKVGDITTIFSGSVRRKIKITSKTWIPDTQMNERVRNELIKTVPSGLGFSGAFRITYEYVDEYNDIANNMNQD